MEQRLPILRLRSAVEAACQGVAVVVGCVCCQDKCPLLGLRPDAKRAAGNLTWLWAGSYRLLRAVLALKRFYFDQIRTTARNPKLVPGDKVNLFELTISYFVLPCDYMGIYLANQRAKTTLRVPL